jgi:hypothetical protein
LCAAPRHTPLRAGGRGPARGGGGSDPVPALDIARPARTRTADSALSPHLNEGFASSVITVRCFMAHLILLTATTTTTTTTTTSSSKTD